MSILLSLSLSHSFFFKSLNDLEFSPYVMITHSVHLYHFFLYSLCILVVFFFFDVTVKLFYSCRLLSLILVYNR